MSTIFFTQSFPSDHDLESLRDATFLNDGIIDVYLQHLLSSTSGIAATPSSFSCKVREHKDVTVMTKRWCLKDTKMVLVPVCMRSHWWLIVVTRTSSCRVEATIFDSLEFNDIKTASMISVSMLS